MITAILVVPVNIFLYVLLETFAIAWPGGYDDERRVKASSNAQLDLNDAANKSRFGEAIEKAVQKGSAERNIVSGDVTHKAYSG